MCKLNFFDKLSAVLVLLGAINWGILGVFTKNIIAILVNDSNFLQRIIYILIFLGAIDLITLIFRCNIFKALKIDK